MSSEAMLWWGFLFGTIGVGYFVYGKRQRLVMPLICGLGLMIFPYFVASTFLLVIIAIIMMAIPFKFKF